MGRSCLQMPGSAKPCRHRELPQRVVGTFPPPSLPLLQPPAPLPCPLGSTHLPHSSDGEMLPAASSPQQNAETESTSPTYHPWIHLSTELSVWGN